MEKFAYTVEEVIESCGIKRDLVYAEINRGNLRTLKVGRRRLIRKEAIKEWLKTHEENTTEAGGMDTLTPNGGMRSE
jgi:excisionase family DNA binding protein